VRAHGQTFAEEAGIRLRDTPQPLYRLLEKVGVEDPMALVLR